MKSFSLKHVVFFTVSILIFKYSQAQDFLITTKGDTIRGDIKPLFYGVEKKIQVDEGNKKKSIYSIVETRSYNYKGENYYPVKGPEGYAFMKLLKPGYLSLYAFQVPGQMHYDGLMLVRRDATSMEVPNLGFKRLMSKFLSDCDKISGQIDRGELARKDLYRIIDEYNACIENISEKLTENHSAKNSWDELEAKVKEHPSFSQKDTALEMITEVKNKLKHAEKVPGFMTDGLKNALADQQDLHVYLETALAEIPK